MVFHVSAQTPNGATHVEEMQFVRVGGSNAVGKQQKITLEPLDLEGGKFETDAGT